MPNKNQQYTIGNLGDYHKICNIVESQMFSLWDIEVATKIIFAFNEAVNNAIDHGKYPISIHIYYYENKQLKIKVKDSGDGFLVKEKGKLINEKGNEVTLTFCLKRDR